MMAFAEAGPSSFQNYSRRRHPEPEASRPPVQRASEPEFDIIDWYPHFQSCYRYFIDVAQHHGEVQSVAAFVNILLPFQRQSVLSVEGSNNSSPRSAGSIPATTHGRQGPTYNVNPHPASANAGVASVIPYLRRLVATGFDEPGILHGFFGNDWVAGIGHLHEVERRNYLFAAKSGSWLEVKAAYDISPYESIPYMKPLKNATEKEIVGAEIAWSEWLAMQDWMVGSRAPAPGNGKEVQSPRIKKERD